MTELLRSHNRVRSACIEEFRASVAEVLNPHRLDPYPNRVRGINVFNAIDLGEVSLCYLNYAVPVRVRPEPLSSFWLVRFSLAGSLIVHDKISPKHYSPQVAAIYDPDAELDMSYEAGARGLTLRLDRAAVHSELFRMLGSPPSRPLRLESSLDMRTPSAQSWWSLLQTLCRDFDGPRGLTHSGLRAPLQRLIISQFLTTVRHSASDELTTALPAGARTAGPRSIRRADQIIADHCHEPLTVSDIAEAVGLSVRSLQNGFRKYLDTTPTQRLRQARLAGIRRELLAAEPSQRSVAQLAQQWGFHHTGRFAESYWQAFGETPRQTLNR